MVFQTITSTAEGVNIEASKDLNNIVDGLLKPITTTAGNANFPTWKLEIAYVFLLSMQQSSSTNFLKILTDDSPCSFHFGEFYNNKGDGGSKGRFKGGKHITHADVHKMTPKKLLEVLMDQVESFAREENLECGGRYVVVAKMFNGHLTFNQHRKVWTQFPNLTTVVLERNVEERWRSLYVALKTDDWSHYGKKDHKEKVS